MKTRFRIEGAEVVLEIPPAGFSLRAFCHFSVALLFTAFVLIACLAFIRELAQRQELFGIAIVALVLIGILLRILRGVQPVLRTVTERYTVRVSGERLHVTTRGLLLSRVAEIPVDELEELHIAKPKHDDHPAETAPIVARSDRTMIEFGRHLPTEEKNWIETVLEHVLTE